MFQTTVPSSGFCPLNIGVHSVHCLCTPLPSLLPAPRQDLEDPLRGARGRCGPSLVRISHCLFCQLLWEGQGKPDEEIPCILSQLREQVDVASTPSDLQKLLHVVTLLANVVTETRAELTESALKVSSWSLIGSQLGRVEERLFHYEHFSLSGIMWAAQQGPS